MAPAVTRTLSVTWGTFTVGGSTDFELDGQVDIHVGWESSSVSFTVLVQADQGAAAPNVDFATKCTSIETNFRTPRLNLVVAQGAATLVSFSHSASTGFTGVPSISKTEDEANTGYARRYHISIDVEMPADVTLTNGRREADIRVIFSPSRRRRCEFSGVYTALPPGGLTARAQYQASIGAFTAGVLSALGGNWELAEEPSVSEDDVEKIVHFSIVFDELIFDQAGGGPDNVSIVRQTLRISRLRTAPGDSQEGMLSGGAASVGPGTGGGGTGAGFGIGGAGGFSVSGGLGSAGIGVGSSSGFSNLLSQFSTSSGLHGGSAGGGGGLGGSTGPTNRLIELDANYECWVDHNSVSPGGGLESLYGTILEFVIEQIKSIFGLKTIAVLDERPNFDLDDNRISASIRAVAATTSGMIEYSLDVEDTQDPGWVLVPVWAGNTISKLKYAGPATQTQSIVEVGLFFGTTGFPPGSTHPPVGAPGEMVPRQSSVKRKPIRMGLDNNTIDLGECTRTSTWEFYEPVDAKPVHTPDSSPLRAGP